jgi:hypothetical protein
MLAEHSRDAPTFRALRPGERDALIIAAARAGMAREAATLTRWTEANKNPPSVRTLRRAIVFRPQRLSLKKCCPDPFLSFQVYAYGALLDLYKRRCDVASCRGVLASLAARGVAPNEVILNTFVAALASNGPEGVAEALALCQAMEARFGVAPSAASFHPLLALAAADLAVDSCIAPAAPPSGKPPARSGGGDGAVAVLNMMFAAGVKATPRTLPTLLVGLVRAGRAGAAADLLEALVARAPGQQASGQQASGQQASGQQASGQQASGQAQGPDRTAQPPLVHPTLWPLLAPALVRNGSLTYAFNVAIGALVAGQSLDRALRLVELSDAIEAPPDAAALNSVLKV